MRDFEKQKLFAWLLLPFSRIGIWRAFFTQILLLIPASFLILTVATGGTQGLRERWLACIIVGDVTSAVCFLIGWSIYRLEHLNPARGKAKPRIHNAAWHFLISLCVAPLGLWLGYKTLWLAAGPLHLGTPRDISLADMRLALFLAGAAAAFLYLVRSRFEISEELTEARLLLSQRTLAEAVPARDAIKIPNSSAKRSEEIRLNVRQGSKIIIVKANEIAAVVARGRYAGLIVNGSELLTDETLDDLAQSLDQDRFFRVHRTAIVNLDFLRELKREGERRYVAVLGDSGHTTVPISRERLPALKEKLGITPTVSADASEESPE